MKNRKHLRISFSCFINKITGNKLLEKLKCNDIEVFVSENGNQFIPVVVEKFGNYSRNKGHWFYYDNKNGANILLFLIQLKLKGYLNKNVLCKKYN